MLQLRLHTIDDIIVVEFIVMGLSESPELQRMDEQLQEALMRSKTKHMVLDCSRLHFIASRALGMVVTLSRLADYHKGKLIICGLREQIRHLFRFSGLDRFLSVMDTRAEALAALAPPPAGDTPK
jgi:anti-anti-sigma factor